jgi:hypothetical protein
VIFLFIYLWTLDVSNTFIEDLTAALISSPLIKAVARDLTVDFFLKNNMPACEFYL